MQKEAFYVYILASKRYGTLYIGVTSDLMKRIWEHKNGVVAGFTKKYKVHQLVWYERHESAESAMKRERNMKEWQRKWKIELIEKSNPHWVDLYESLKRAI
jgi:putative endonuclease